MFRFAPQIYNINSPLSRVLDKLFNRNLRMVVYYLTMGGLLLSYYCVIILF